MITRRKLFKLAGGAAAIAVAPKPLLALETPPVVYGFHNLKGYLTIKDKEELNAVFGPVSSEYAAAELFFRNSRYGKFGDIPHDKL